MEGNRPSSAGCGLEQRNGDAVAGRIGDLGESETELAGLAELAVSLNSYLRAAGADDVAHLVQDSPLLR
jgi:hypothetical protein